MVAVVAEAVEEGDDDDEEVKDEEEDAAAADKGGKVARTCVRYNWRIISNLGNTLFDSPEPLKPAFEMALRNSSLDQFMKFDVILSTPPPTAVLPPITAARRDRSACSSTATPTSMKSPRASSSLRRLEI